jgi:hypothetical protein
MIKLIRDQAAVTVTARFCVAAGMLLLGAISPNLYAAPGDASPDRKTIESRIHGIKAWITASRAGKTQAALPNGTTRTVTYQKSPGGQLVEDNAPADLQLTAACKSLEFLAKYAEQFGVNYGTTRENLQTFIGYLKELQSSRQNAVHYGALANDRSRRSYVTFSNAICGKALLSAYKVLGDRELLSMATQIGDYLLRLFDIGEQLAKPPPGVQNNTQIEYGVFDRVTGDEKIQVTSSTWNMVAAAFLKELSVVTGAERYSAVSRKILAFQLHGLEHGYDYFSPKLQGKGTQVITRWNLGYTSVNSEIKHEFSDGKWHRHGDIRSPPTGTVGTDQIEYSLQALFNMSWDADKLQRLYLKYRQLQNSVSCLDPSISFTGYFRMFDAAGAQVSHAYGAYYDIVGAGILADVKQAYFPEDHEKSIRAMILNNNDWAIIDCNFEPIWSTGKDKIQFSKRSTLVSATTGIALLHKIRAMDQATRPKPAK